MARTSTTLGIVLALAGALPLAGCLDTHGGQPHHGTPPDLLGQRSVPGLNAPIPDHWSRIFVGSLPHPRLMGYVRNERREGKTRPLYVNWVYDFDFQLIGVVSDTGRVTRVDRHGKVHALGQLPPELAILALFDVEIDDRPELTEKEKAKAASAPREASSVVLTAEEASDRSRALVRFLPMPDPKD